MLAYLRDAVEARTAKYVIKSLSHSSGSYRKAVECLLQRYDKRRFIHQNHIRAIIKAPTIKQGIAKELWLLHDTLNQHVHSLRTIKGDTFEAFVSSLIEMKLYWATKIASWQTVQEWGDMPSIDELLEFINSRAQASESAIHHNSHPPQHPSQPSNNKKET